MFFKLREKGFMELVITIGIILAAAGFGLYLIWLEKRPVEIGKPRLVPLTPLLFLCVLIVIMGLAHMLSLLTGTPYTGRMGRL